MGVLVITEKYMVDKIASLNNLLGNVSSNVNSSQERTSRIEVEKGELATWTVKEGELAAWTVEEIELAA